MTKNEKITRLNGLWCSTLVEHHKNRDCQHFLYMEYCFGGIEYIAEHFGYVASEYSEHFHTLNAAQDYLIKKLQEQIREECNHQLYALERPDEYDTNKDKNYWNNILTELDKIKDLVTDDIESKVNEEQYHDMERKYNSLQFHYGLAEEVLDKNEIPQFSKEYPEMLYSINYRLELLIKKLKLT